MIKSTLILLCLLTVSLVNAQQRAVTELGEEVILYDDGTWEYQNQDDLSAQEIPTNTKVFTKDDESTFLLKSSRFNVGFYLNPKLWSFQKASNNEDAEYEFQLKDGDLFGLLISEKIEIPLTTMRKIALENAQSVSPDMKVVKEEFRTVNGLRVLCLQMNGTMKGIKISYYGYYFSNSNGTVQFLTYTSQGLLDSYLQDIEKFLNGLVEIN